MAKQPKKRPGSRPDFAENAFRVMQEATGQKPKTPAPADKDAAAVSLGSKGGKARAKGMSKKARAASAKKAAAARWEQK